MVVDWGRKLKLGISTGLIMGVGVMVIGALVGYGWMMSNWEGVSELLALGIGLVYTTGYAKQIVKEKRWMVLVTGYETFLLVVILAWMLWVLLVMIVANRSQEVELVERVLELLSNGGMERGLMAVMKIILGGLGVAVKWSVLGLGVVFGYRWYSVKQKN